MKHLQRISLHQCLRAPAVFQLMPSSLTAIRVEGCGRLTTTSPDQLSNLLELQLGSLIVDPSLLYSFPKLQQLVLRTVKLLPATMPGDAQPNKQQHAESMRHLYAALGKMTKQRYLVLSYGTALARRTGTAAAARVDDTAIGRRIATSCPALRELKLYYILRDEAAASRLENLTGLTAVTCLDLMGLGCHDTAAAAVAQLTRLRDLSFQCGCKHNVVEQGLVTVSALQQLTALSSLTHLYLRGWHKRDGGLRPKMPWPKGYFKDIGKLTIETSHEVCG